MDKQQYQQIKGALAEYISKKGDQKKEFSDHFSNTYPDLAQAFLNIIGAEHKEHSSLLDQPHLEINHTIGNQNTLENSQNINKYTIVSKIGSGGMSDVYKAIQKFPAKRHVALKIMKVAPNQDQLIEETKVLARLNHLNIATLYEIDQTPEGQLYVAMELIQGPDIISHCQQQYLNIRQIIKLFLQLCDGIGHAHEKGIIHCDIKPSNVLISDVEKSPVLKIIDFGVSKFQQSVDKSGNNQKLAGTPAYMSPEAFENQQLMIDTRHDVYAMGVLLYRMLYGAMPDSKDNKNKLGIDLELIIKKAMAQRESRYNTVHLLSQDLKNYLALKEVSARKPSPLYSMGLFIRRRYVSVLFLSAIFISIIGGYYFQMIQAQAALLAQKEAEKTSDFLIELFNVANPEVSQSKKITAQELIDQARDKLLTIENPDLSDAKFMHTLGAVYQRMDSLVDAETMLKNSLEIKTKQLSFNDTDVIIDLIQLGSNYRRMELYDKAIEHLNLALRELGKQKNPDETQLAYIHNHLGNVYWKLKKSQKSINHHQQALSFRNKNNEIKLIADSEINLGVIFRSLEKWNESIFHFKNAEKLYLQEYGPDHPYVFFVKNNMSYIYERKFYDFDKGKKLMLEAYQGLEKIYGEDHYNTIVTLTNLAKIHSRLLEYDKSEMYWLKVIEAYKRTNNVKSQAKSLARLGMVYNHMQRIADSDDAHKKAIEIIHLLPKKDESITATIIYQYAESLISQNKYAKSNSLLLQSKNLIKQLNNPLLYKNFIVDNLIARINFETLQLDQSELLYRHVLKTNSKDSILNSTQNIKALLGLGNVFRTKNDLNISSEYYHKALDLSLKVFKENNPYLAQAKFEIGLNHMINNQGQQALNWFNQAYEIQQIILPENHPDRLKTAQKLGKLKSNLD